MKRRDFIALGGLFAAALVTGCPRAEPPEGEPAEDPQVACPQCGAMNTIVTGPDGEPAEITCWRCGHTWTPSVPA